MTLFIILIFVSIVLRVALATHENRPIEIDTPEEAFGTFFMFLVVLGIVLFPRAYVLMYGLGLIGVTITYWQAYLVALLIGLMRI